MGRITLGFLCALVLSSCGQDNYEQLNPPGSDQNGPSAANLVPMASFRVGSADRFFEQQHQTQCTVAQGGQGSSVLEIAFNDQANSTSLQINLVGFNPSNPTHQIVGNRQQNSGGSILLSLQGNNGQSRYQNSDQTKCDFQLASEGDKIRGYFSCNQVANSQRQTQKASGTFICRYTQMGWR